WQHLVMPFLNLSFVRGVPDSVLPLYPWHWLVLLHQVSCPERFTPFSNKYVYFNNIKKCNE
ncbi:hypothetical protein, partial [Bacillus altitudinis]|uniref:hypothetical protein n=1 Tax=Bacillus altitudinis TaxID=293387 RepID=UPI001A7E9F3F